MEPKVVFTCMLLLLLWRCSLGADSSTSFNVCDTLYLLNVVPYPDNSTFAGWDRGFDLIPAGHLATRHINSRPDILRGVKLEVINVASEACGRSLIIEGFLHYYLGSLGVDSRCVYGIVGLYCSTVTNIIAPIANHRNIGFVQLAASTSPLHRDTEAFPYTFHTISSSRIFNQAMIALMDQFGWNRVNAVYDSLGFYFRSTGDDFVRLIDSDPDKSLTSNTPIQPQPEIIARIFGIINNEAARISYFSVSEGESATFFCEAYKRRFLWPGYVYVLQERSVEQIQSTEVDCTPEQIQQALEGAFFLQYRLFGIQNTELFSGITYEQFHDQYVEEVKKFAQETGMNLEDNPYANTLYDQVWAYALAANMSVDNIDFYNRSISRDSVEHLIRVRDELARNLNKVRFEGVSGLVDFGSRKEILTSVEIFQVQNGSQVLIGEYNAANNSITFFSNFNRSSVPGDAFEVRNRVVPEWLGVLAIVLDLSLLLLILFNSFVVVVWKDRPEIKSGSFMLSVILLIGCVVLCISPIFKSIIAVYVITSPAIITVMCNVQLWSFIAGNFLIFVTLLIRLLRVFHVFRSYHSTGKYWSDKYLLLYIILTWSSMIVLLVLWTVISTYQYNEDRRYISTGNPPFYSVYRHCSSGDSLGIWLAVSFSLIALVMILLVFLAIQTRHIKHKHFKDTKKVNVFIFSTCGVYAVFLPLWVILTAADYIVWAFVCLMIANLAGPALCQLFLFLPKVIPALVNRKKKKVTLRSTANTYTMKYNVKNLLAASTNLAVSMVK